MKSNLDIEWQPGWTLDLIEKAVILKALKFYENNKTQTAISLGISVRTIDNKILRYEEEEKLNGQDDKVNYGTAEIQTTAQLQMEPSSSLSPEFTLPVPKRQEVQEMSLKSASGSGSRKGR